MEEKENKSKETIKKMCEQIEKKLEALTKEGIQQNNVDYIGKLIDIKKDIKEMEESEMYNNYGNYGRDYYDNYSGGRMRDSQGRFMEGNYNNRYGRRYRGDDTIDEMAMHYGNYMENRENGRYGSPEMNKALDYMLASVEEFMGMLKNDASSQEEVEKIRKTAEKISRM